MLLEWMMNGHAILYTGVTLAFWSTILIVGKAIFSLNYDSLELANLCVRFVLQPLCFRSFILSLE